MSIRFFKSVLLMVFGVLNFSCLGQQVASNLEPVAVKKEEPVKIDNLIKKDNQVKNRLEDIKREKKFLKNEMQRKEAALKADRKEWKTALETQAQNEFSKVEKRLESLEIKFEINKLKKERDFIKKYEREGIRKTRLHKLRISQKELEDAKYFGKKNKNIDKKVKDKIFKDKKLDCSGPVCKKCISEKIVDKDLSKIKKEIETIEKISQKGYAKNRLLEIDKKLDVLVSRTNALKENTVEPKKYNKYEIKSNLDKIDQELRYLKSSLGESILALELQEAKLKGA